MNASVLKELQNVLDRAVENNEIPGGNLLVIKDGEEIAYVESGYADREAGKKIQRDNIFRLYSMSKPITSVAVMQLVERGLIDLGQPVKNFLPGFDKVLVEKDGELTESGELMTVKNLMDMTSGLLYPGTPGIAGKYADDLFREIDERLFTENPMTTMEFAERCGKGPLQFVPGSEYRYGTSADVLGALVEAVSGMRFGEYLDENIFKPLGMKDTGFTCTDENRDRLVVPYNEDCSAPYTGNNLGIMNGMKFGQPAFESGGAGLVSTLDDYAKLGQAMLNGGELNGVRILAPGTVKYMTAGSLTEEQYKSFQKNFSNMPGFTYGNLLRVMKHTGTSFAYDAEGTYGWDGWLGCYFGNDPVNNMTILFMTNRENSGLLPIVRRLKNVIMRDIL